jgi:LCP family protein required for cell wall assembly
MDLDVVTEASATGCSVLVVGTDRRPRSATIDDVEGGRADTIVLVVCDRVARRIDAITVARSLGAEIPMVGYQRLGWALDYGGPDAIATAVRRLLDVSLHHYVEVDFRGFAAIVSASGGVRIDVDHALRDRRTGLELPAGRSRLDGHGALAFVRSRYQDAEVDGEVRSVSLGDAARRHRLRLVLEALAAQVRSGVGPLAGARLGVAAARHLIVDERLLRRVSGDPALMSMLVGPGAAPIHFTDLPTRAARSTAELRSPFPPHQLCGSDYLEIDVPQATALLERVRTVVGRTHAD